MSFVCEYALDWVDLNVQFDIKYSDQSQFYKSKKLQRNAVVQLICVIVKQSRAKRAENFRANTWAESLTVRAESVIKQPAHGRVV